MLDHVVILSVAGFSAARWVAPGIDVVGRRSRERAGGRRACMSTP
jgi:hypothetical protein